MASEVKVPALGESVTEATLGEWLKQPGDAVALDEPIASLETDKVAIEVGATAAGIGRPYLWGLGAFGQPGVERVLELMRIETRAAMMQCGVRSVKELTKAFVGKF